MILKASKWAGPALALVLALAGRGWRCRPAPDPWHLLCQKDGRACSYYWDDAGGASSCWITKRDKASLSL